MKKSTKKLLMALGIILIFGMSSIAFVATGLLGGAQNTNKFTPLESPVVEGELAPIYESTYVGNGFTWIKFYHTNATQEFLSFMDSLPQSFTTTGGQFQIIVQKINSKYLNETNYMIITSNAGQESFSDVSEQKVFDSLCRLLTVTPIDCTLANTNLTR